MQDFRKMNVWKQSDSFAYNIYKITLNFPKEEKYNLISQLKRAALSIPTNIAEGCGRRTKKNFIRFLYIAIGSANEVEYLLSFSDRLNYISETNYNKHISEIRIIRKMLINLIKSINSSK